MSCFLIYIYYILFFFFFNDTATTEIYTLSLHDALPIYVVGVVVQHDHAQRPACGQGLGGDAALDQRPAQVRSEEHTSELQSRLHLVCRLLLEKKKSKTAYLRSQ